MNVKKNKKGFTLMEMLIVVAIIAVLVAIAIPVLSNNLHNAKVATDWANLRSYYAYLQADLIQTGERLDEIDGVPFSSNDHFLQPHTRIVYPDGTVIPMKIGTYYVTYSNTSGGYQILYYCDKYLQSEHNKCELILGEDK